MFVLNQNCIPRKEGFYYSCEWIEHGLVFFPSKLTMCCFCGSKEGQHTLIQDNFNGKSFDVERIFKNRDKFRRFHKKGKIHTNCYNCPSLRLDAWDERNYLDCIYISHWSNCNSKCVYCYSMQHPEEFSNDNYSIMPILKQLVKKGLLRRNSKILFGGGEPAVLNEFEEIINYLLDNGFQNIRVHSSGIKYIPCLERGLKEGKIHLAISVDAGSSEIYKKIKNVDCYDLVRENIKKYAQCKTSSGEANVSAKYIIIPEINDTKEEIEKWLVANKEAGLSYTILDIEENWYNKNKKNIPDYIYELLRYSKMRSDELQTHFELYERIGNLLD
jgi:organic radical activating enzyme